MPIILIILAVVLPLAGVLVGRIYERDRWQRRLLERTGLFAEEPDRIGRSAPAVAPGVQPAPDAVSQALESMALEIERIGEGQRFLTRLLADRDQRASSRAPGSMRSPIPPAS